MHNKTGFQPKTYSDSGLTNENRWPAESGGDGLNGDGGMNGKGLAVSRDNTSRHGSTDPCGRPDLGFVPSPTY